MSWTFKYASRYFVGRNIFSICQSLHAKEKEQYLENVYEDLREKQVEEDEQRILNEQKLREERMEKIQGESKAPIPINTPPIDTEIFTASRVSPTISGTVDQTTGLTGTESALLSPFEKEIAKRQNQGIGSLA